MIDRYLQGNNATVASSFKSCVQTKKVRFMEKITATDFRRKAGKERLEIAKKEKVTLINPISMNVSNTLDDRKNSLDEERAPDDNKYKQNNDGKKVLKHVPSAHLEFIKVYEELLREFSGIQPFVEGEILKFKELRTDSVKNIEKNECKHHHEEELETERTLEYKKFEGISRELDVLLSSLKDELMNLKDYIERLTEMEHKCKEECIISAHKVVQERIVSLVHSKQKLECDMKFLQNVKKQLQDSIMALHVSGKNNLEKRNQLSTNLNTEVKLYQKELDEQKLQQFLLKSQQMLDFDLNM